MVLDILLFRDAQGGNSNLIRESERRRYNDPKVVDEVIAADERRKKSIFLMEQSKRLIGQVSKTVGERKKKKEADGDIEAIPDDVKHALAEGTLNADAFKPLCVLQLKALSKFIGANVPVLERAAEDAEKHRDQLLAKIGNIVHESVPVEIDEDKGNTVVKTWGDCARRMPLNHVSVMERLGAMDCSAAVTKMSGGRAYVLKGGLVQLQLALTTYAMNFLIARKYNPLYPPFFLNKDVMGEVAQLGQFDDELYKVTGEGEEKYLTATSEQSIAAYHRGKWFTEIPEPIRYAGFSTCFRKEVGAHGRDTLGIFRVHQFDKIEQFVVCSPRDNQSWKVMDEMMDTCEAFYQSLGLPYRIVNICSGALNNAAAKKYDLECWFPASGAFRELVSCSNCTDYQARRLNCRFGNNARNQAAVNVKEHPHMLNSTLCAITRTMCCIAENYQTEEGVRVPEVLRPYMLGTDFIKFDPDAKDSAAPAAK